MPLGGHVDGYRGKVTDNRINFKGFMAVKIKKPPHGGHANGLVATTEI
tara:strand:- start:53 stop:196 length:144 start_codon:yes stop_codon:yes gene_type:complete